MGARYRTKTLVGRLGLVCVGGGEGVTHRFHLKVRDLGRLERKLLPQAEQTIMLAGSTWMWGLEDIISAGYIPRHLVNIFPGFQTLAVLP